MIFRNIFISSLVSLCVLSCTSSKTNSGHYQRSDGDDSFLAISQKYENGLEVYEAIDEGSFVYEHKPTRDEGYSFEYIANSEYGIPSGIQSVSGKLEAMAEDLITHLEGDGATHRGSRTDIVLIPTTFVNIDDMSRTTSFGRFCSEQLANYLSVKGVTIIEVRKLENILIKRKSGEYGVSRISDELVTEFNANSILVGNYTITPTDVILNVRMIAATNSATVRSAATGNFARKDNFVVNYLVSKVNSLKVGDYQYGNVSEAEIPEIGITTVDISDEQNPSIRIRD
jgi:hypothetical protein